MSSYSYLTIFDCWHRGGDWRTGGTCHMETLPELGSSLVPSHTWARYNIFFDMLSSSQSNTSDLKPLNVLNITHMTSRRKDGHSSLYYLGPEVGPAAINRQDCSHWCLPGVPDTWNELLYALFMKREASRMIQNTSTFHFQWKIGCRLDYCMLFMWWSSRILIGYNAKKNVPKKN